MTLLHNIIFHVCLKVTAKFNHSLLVVVTCLTPHIPTKKEDVQVLLLLKKKKKSTGSECNSKCSHGLNNHYSTTGPLPEGERVISTGIFARLFRNQLFLVSVCLLPQYRRLVISSVCYFNKQNTRTGPASPQTKGIQLQ